MKRRDFVKTSGLLTLALFTPALWPAPAAAQKQARPNILVIVADDLGYADLGCQGCTDVPTPHIDSLAKNGVRCTNGYVSCPVCSPTRAGLMTGRYQQRFGHELNPGPPLEAGAEFGLPLTEVTLADRLKALGYKTGMVGKWHLGLNEKYHPLRRGFDEYFGFLHGAHSYWVVSQPDANRDRGNPVLRGFQEVAEKEYLTDAFTREAVAFLDRQQREPFFLYLTYNAVHAPMQAPEKYLQRFPNIKDQTRRTLAAMLSAMDDGVGAVLAKLRQAGLEENTLIFFISDNGGPTRVNTSRNDPLSGFKGQVFEGGIRVPFLVQWKGRLPAGKVYDHPVIALDIHPTAVTAAGGQVSGDRPLDGVNLLPYLSSQNTQPPHERLFWRFGSPRAVRQGNWKLIKDGSNSVQLFDLAADAGEKNNRAGQKPEVVKELEDALTRWEAQLVKPLWGGRK